MKGKCALWGIMILSSLSTLASVPPPTLSKEAWITLVDTIYLQKKDKITYEELHDRLWKFHKHPLNLNHASREAIEHLGLLTEAQINAFFKHITQQGPLFSIYELQAIPTFDLPTIYQLLPFVYIPEVAHPDPRPIWQRAVGHSYGLIRYSCASTYHTNLATYQAAPDTIAMRLILKHPHDFSTGVIVQKKYPWIRLSLHALLANQGHCKIGLLGDYQIAYGQGLVVNTGFSMHKSSAAIDCIKTSNLGIKPHTAFSKARLRGVATTWQWQDLEITLYYSHTHVYKPFQRKKKAQIKNKPSKHPPKQKKSPLKEHVIGTTGLYKNTGATLGMNALYILSPKRLDNPPIPEKPCLNLGLFYTGIWKNCTFFGEAAISPPGGKAFLTGLIASLSARVDLALLVRHYDQGFHNPYGNAFGENTTNSNEQGLYVGTHLYPLKGVHITAYYDRFRFPAPTPKAHAPSQGYRWFSKAVYQLRQPTLLSIQYQQIAKAKNKPKNKEIAMGKKRNYQVQLKNAWKRIKLISSVQKSQYTFLEQITHGYSIAQDISYSGRHITLNGRIAWFTIDDYANRHVRYESNVLYNGLNFIAYQGQGMKYTALLCYKPIPAVRLEIKYALTWNSPAKDHHPTKRAGTIQQACTLQAIILL